MDILSVVGARPQFIKLAPVAAAIAEGSHRHVVVHTGQHYDTRLSDVFFEGLALPPPDVQLGIGSGSHAVQTAAMMAALEPVLEGAAPDWVLVYGDTNSTLAAALVAVKLHQRIAHVEAGLRSFNRRMPEEHNRVLVDHASDLLLAPTSLAVRRLATEGLADRTELVGDVMADVCLAVAAHVADRPPALPDGLDPTSPFYVATVHRAENTDDPARLRAVVEALAGLPAPTVLPVHPRLADRAAAAGIDLASGSLRPTQPLDYQELIATVRAAAGVVTDSGGLQKEAFLLRVPCTTLRHETEWEETVELGWNVLAGDLQALGAVVSRPPPPATTDAPYGAGDAARRIVTALELRS